MTRYADLDKPSAGRMLGRVKLVVLSLVLIATYFLLPPNREAIRFARERFRRFPVEWSLFRAERDPERRLRLNYGMNYDAPMFIRDNMEDDDRLQLPPRAYIAPYCPSGEDGWTDPRAVYYIAGPLKVFAWLGSIRPEATHALVVDTLGATPGLRIVDVRPQGIRDQVTDLYRRAERRR